MGHIPQDYTLDDYNNLIKSIVNDNENEMMETAYEIIDMDYEQHFQKQGYYFLGTLKEVVNFDRTNEKNK